MSQLFHKPPIGHVYLVTRSKAATMARQRLFPAQRPEACLGTLTMLNVTCPQGKTHYFCHKGGAARVPRLCSSPKTEDGLLEETAGKQVS